MKVLTTVGLTELITKIKSWSRSTFLNKTDIVEASTLSIDNIPTASSSNLVTSGGVASALNQKYTKPAGGIPASDIASGVIPDVSSKTDKVTGATNGNFAGLDNNGNLTDSGKKSSDFATAAQGAKADTALQEHQSLSAYSTTTEMNTAISSYHDNSKLDATLKGANNGVAELGADGKVPATQLPSYVDDVLEYASASNFPTTGESGKIYVALDTNKTYRWGGSSYVEISESIALGETSTTAYRGDRGKVAYDHSQLTTGNPHDVTKTDIGLDNVGNFKAVSTEASQGLNDTEKSNARANIGAGTSSFSGSYNDLSNKPTIPSDAGDIAYDGTETYASGTVGAELTAQKGDIAQLDSDKLDADAVVTSVSASSTDTEVPSAKLFYDTCGNIEATLQAIRGTA